MCSGEDIIALSKLAISGKEADIRLYLAKLVRKLRATAPKVSQEIEELLKSNPTRSSRVLRKDSSLNSSSVLESSTDSSLPLLKSFNDVAYSDKPILDSGLESTLEQVIEERKFSEQLKSAGLAPSSSLIFQGPPGVGKTMTAGWLATELNLPLYTLDLTAVMSSYLGKTGSNLRAVIDFAKSHPCVLLLDEIDAIAKRRSDEADIGELKRLVTVMLQELDNWPSEGLLVAATNHPELVDPALWRRFDIVVNFNQPTEFLTRKAIVEFLGDDLKYFEELLNLFVYLLKDTSYSNIKRKIQRVRKIRILNPDQYRGMVLQYLLSDIGEISRSERIDLAVKLVMDFSMPQTQSSELTGVSRDTIRKRVRL